MGPVVTLRRRVHGSGESLWRALTVPAELAAWQADRVAGVVELGGHLLLGWPALGAEVDLDVVEYDEPRLLGLSTGSSVVRFGVADNELTVSLEGLTSNDEVEGTRAAWEVSLATLGHYLGRHAGQTRNVTWAIARARTTASIAHAFFTDEAALATWLTRSGRVGGAGEPLALELEWGERLSGRVLASTPGRDVAFSWADVHDSVLALRTLPAPFEEGERLLIGTWSCWGHAPDPRTVARLQAAFGRLARILAQGADA